MIKIIVKCYCVRAGDLLNTTVFDNAELASDVVRALLMTELPRRIGRIEIDIEE